MNIIVVCIGLVLSATLIITFILELIKQDGLYDGSILNSVMTNYKANIWQILIAFLWIGGILFAIELILTLYDGARMRYRLRIEFFERLEDFYYRQLPQMTLVYTKTPELTIQPPIQQLPPIQHPPPVQQPPPVEQPPIIYTEPELLPRRQTRRRSYL